MKYSMQLSSICLLLVMILVMMSIFDRQNYQRLGKGDNDINYQFHESGVHTVPDNNIVDVDVEWYLANEDKFDPVKECLTYIPHDQLTVPTERYLIALASYPRSGNRFTRQHLIRITFQNKLAYKLAHGLDVNAELICYKTHAHDLPTIKFYTDGAILLLRNPRDSAVSLFFLKHRQINDTDTVKQWIKTNDPIWTNWTKKVLVNWREMNLDWITFGHKVLISYMEDISKNPVRELARMIIFAGEMVPLGYLQCSVFRNPWVFRKHLDFEPSFPEQLMNECVTAVNTTLQSIGAKPLPTYPSTYL